MHLRYHDHKDRMSRFIVTLDTNNNVQQFDTDLMGLSIEVAFAFSVIMHPINRADFFLFHMGLNNTRLLKSLSSLNNLKSIDRLACALHWHSHSQSRCTRSMRLSRQDSNRLDAFRSFGNVRGAEWLGLHLSRILVVILMAVVGPGLRYSTFWFWFCQIWSCHCSLLKLYNDPNGQEVQIRIYQKTKEDTSQRIQMANLYLGMVGINWR